MNCIFNYLKSLDSDEDIHRIFTLLCLEILKKEKSDIKWNITSGNKEYCDFENNGIDIIGFDINEDAIYIICAFIDGDILEFDQIYDTYNYIELGRMETSPSGIVMSNAKYAGKELINQIISYTKYGGSFTSYNINNLDLFLKSDFNDLNPEFYISAYNNAVNNTWDKKISADTRIEINPRPYQAKAIDAGVKWFRYNYTGTLKIINGVGKIFIAAWIILNLKSWNSYFVTSTPAEALKIKSILQKMGVHRGKNKKGILCLLDEDEIGDTITGSFASRSFGFKAGRDYISLWKERMAYQNFNGNIIIITYKTFKRFNYNPPSLNDNMTILVNPEIMNGEVKIQNEPKYTDLSKYIFITQSPKQAGIKPNYRGEERTFYNYTLSAAIRDEYIHNVPEKNI